MHQIDVANVGDKGYAPDLDTGQPDVESDEEADSPWRAHANTPTNYKDSVQADAHADYQADVDVDAHAYAQGDVDAEAHADAHADAHAYAQAHVDVDADVYAHAQADAEADAHVNYQADADVHNDAHTDAHADAHTDAEAHTDAYSDAQADAFADAHADAQANHEDDTWTEDQVEPQVVIYNFARGRRELAPMSNVHDRYPSAPSKGYLDTFEALCERLNAVIDKTYANASHFLGLRQSPSERGQTLCC